jgi:hypothetical protein
MLKDDIVSVKECKSLLINKDLHSIKYYSQQFCTMPEGIKFLETQNLKQSTSLKLY